MKSLLCIVCLGLAASGVFAEDAPPLDCTIQVGCILEYDAGDFLWYHPRAAVIPGETPVALMTLQKHLFASDHYSGLHVMTSTDNGVSWTAPVCPPELDWKPGPDGATIAVCDVTPGWHAQTGKLLMIGALVHYDAKGNQLTETAESRQAAYAVYDPKDKTWTSWRILALPARKEFFHVTCGCAQWLVEPDGTLLVPLYVDEDSKRYSAVVARCAFDGNALTCLDTGDIFSLDVERGLCESSLAKLGDRYFLTLRNDVKGYITSGADGLHFAPIAPWTFDDGAELGSYNTQQHWVTHNGGLFLVYTRSGANNDHIIRNRAPLFIAQVDTERLCVLRATERVLIPERGGEMGNFGACNVGENESWVTVSEGIWSDDARKRGATGCTFIARIKWNQ